MKKVLKTYYGKLLYNILLRCQKFNHWFDSNLWVNPTPSEEWEHYDM